VTQIATLKQTRVPHISPLRCGSFADVADWLSFG